MQEASYLRIDYSPANYRRDLEYLRGQNIGHVKEYNSKRYKRNKEYISDITNFLTKDFIRNGANVNRKPLRYIDWESETAAENGDDWVDRRRVSLHQLEKYKNLNGQALHWTYKQDDLWMFKALHASEYLIIYDEAAKIKAYIIQTGEYAAQEGKKLFYFMLWINGRVYKTVASSWLRLPEIENIKNGEKITSEWVLNIDETGDYSNYKKFPFSIIGGDIAFPISSILPVLENIMSGGAAYGDIAAQRSFLDMIYGVSRLSPAKWQKFMKDIGMFKYPNIPIDDSGSNSQQGQVNSLKLGDGNVQMQWFNFMTMFLKMVAHAEGVDHIGMFGDIKVESGTARRMMLESVINVREENINTFRSFELMDQGLLIDLEIVSQRSRIVYPELDIGLSELEKQQIEKARQANIKERYSNKTITRVQFVMETERLTKKEAQKRIREIDAEEEKEFIKAQERLKLQQASSPVVLTEDDIVTN